MWSKIWKDIMLIFGRDAIFLSHPFIHLAGSTYHNSSAIKNPVVLIIVKKGPCIQPKQKLPSLHNVNSHRWSLSNKRIMHHRRKCHLETVNEIEFNKFVCNLKRGISLQRIWRGKSVHVGVMSGIRPCHFSSCQWQSLQSHVCLTGELLGIMTLILCL